MSYTLYKHTCIISNKHYIGITNQIPEKRWGSNGCGYKKEKQRKMYNAIQKYGWNNFMHEILISDIKTLKEANALEIEYIEKYDSYYNGYNMTKGGDGTCGHKVSEDSRKKMSISHTGIKMKPHTEEWKKQRSQEMMGEKNPMYGKKPWNAGRPTTPEEKEKNRIAHLGLPSPRKGKKLSEESKRKISEKNKGKKAWNKGKKYTDEEKKNFIIESRCKKVKKMTKENHEYIETFLSVEQAAKSVNGDPNNIRKVCKNKKGCKSSYGYFWEYVDE